MSTYLQSSTEFRSTRLKPRRKLDFIHANEIRVKYFTQGFTQTELGIMFGVTSQNISHIVNFKTHRFSR